MDDADLLARDEAMGSPRWRLSLQTSIAAVLLTAPDSLPSPPTSEGPWRVASWGRNEGLLAVGVDGALYSVDPTLGRSADRLGPFGPPSAVAASFASAAVALAVGETVLLWRRGEQGTLALRASALAFSNDGGTLAVGTANGGLRLFDLAPALPKQTAHVELGGEVLDLSQHPGGDWIVSTRKGVFCTSAAGLTSALPKLPAGAERVRFDASGRRLAIQRSPTEITVYEWPALDETLSVRSGDRPVHGLAFGPRDRLAVGLDRAEAETVGLVTSSATSSASSLVVERPKERLAAAKEAEDIRRMTPPYQRQSLKWRIAGTLLGTSLVASGVAVALGIFATRSVAGRSATPVCDEACAGSRLEKVRYTCVDHPELRCVRAAGAAQDALSSGRCAKARRALAHIERNTALGDWNQILGSDLLHATHGLEEACSGRTAEAPAMPSPLADHPRLVRLEGNELVPSIEPIFEAHPIEGELPRAMWVATDGSVFVATTPHEDAYDPSVRLHRRSPSASWSVTREDQKDLTEIERVTVFAWTNGFVSVVTEGSFKAGDGRSWPTENVRTFDGTSWNVETLPVFCETERGVITLVKPMFRNGCPEGTRNVEPLRSLFALGVPSPWAFTRDRGHGSVLLHSLDSTEWGRWAFAQPPERSFTIDDVWVSASGDAYVASRGRVLRTNGTRWATLPAAPLPVAKLWGRSNEDIYGGSSEGLVHFDGTRWSKTSYQGRVVALGGTPAAVLVLTTTGADDRAGQGRARPPSQ